MLANVEPTPSEEERNAILAALSPPPAAQDANGWAALALLEGVEDGEPDP